MASILNGTIGSLKMASNKVRRNKGTHGVDGIKAEKAEEYLNTHEAELIKELKHGLYKPNSIRQVSIPKGAGKTREIGIPTVRDRIVQTAMVQVLTQIYEPSFHQNSYGFRPGRNAGQMVSEAVALMNQGYKWITRIDLKSFFDNIPHDKLMSTVNQRVKETKTLTIIHRFLKARIVDNKGRRVQKAPDKGAIQGGNLSPLLANIYLNELDWELDRRSIKFLRYADDVVILSRTREAAARTTAGVERFIEKMGLTLNTDKTRQGLPEEMQILGFGFVEEQGRYKSYITQEAIRELERSLQVVIRETDSKREAIETINQIIRGWNEYYGQADNELSLNKLHNIDGLIYWRIYERYGKGIPMKELKKNLVEEGLIGIKQIHRSNRGRLQRNPDD